MKVGDTVVRKSYGKDICFKIVAIRGDRIILRGIFHRVEADSEKDDLEIIDSEEMLNRRAELEKKTRGGSSDRGLSEAGSGSYGYRDQGGDKFEVVGKVLQLDGDKEYLEECLKKYEEAGVPAVGAYVEPQNQPQKIYALLQQHKPHILVLTGHDSIKKGITDYEKVDSYINSQYYIQAVQEARRYNPNFDSLIIFAGACQSYYAGIIKSGANFASSPQRVLIHCA